MRLASIDLQHCDLQPLCVVHGESMAQVGSRWARAFPHEVTANPSVDIVDTGVVDDPLLAVILVFDCQRAISEVVHSTTKAGGNRFLRAEGALREVFFDIGFKLFDHESGIVGLECAVVIAGWEPPTVNFLL